MDFEMMAKSSSDLRVVQVKEEPDMQQRMDYVKKMLGVRYDVDIFLMAFNHFAEHVENGEVFWQDNKRQEKKV